MPVKHHLVYLLMVPHGSDHKYYIGMTRVFVRESDRAAVAARMSFHEAHTKHWLKGTDLKQGRDPDSGFPP